ncbi:MAG: CoA transferase [Burkholderiales bacterium]|nr:CoA transferase [Burkholderiales bacterium]
MSRPLTGKRIIEVGHMLMGPYCGMLLADLGAEVIKIEPREGDIARSISPHRVGGHDMYFASLNRNKKSIVLDLASERGRADLFDLARTAAGLITNLRPGAIRKLGLTYDTLKSANPRIVCVALTGYGLDSPFAERPAYDYVIQALTGVMALTGDPDDPPTKTGYSAVDNSAGIMGAVGLLAKLVEGKGGQVDIAMYDVMLSQLNYLAGAWLNVAERPERHANSAHPYIVPAQIFPTQDGWLTLFITHDRFWKLFCEEIKKPEWIDDSCFATMQARRANRALVLEQIAEVLAADTARHWVSRLAPLGIVVADVESLDLALASEHTRARGMVADIASGEGKIRVVGNPIKLSGVTDEYRAPPKLGEHDGAVLNRAE